MKIKRKKTAVSEVIGVAVLLGISISMYSVVQYIVFSYPFEPATPSVNLIGSINENENSTKDSGEERSISIGNFGGESISIDAKIIIRINNLNEETFTFIARNHTTSNLGNPELWEIGEFILINETDLTNAKGSAVNLNESKVYVTVIDAKTNSVVMMGYIQEGNS